ncbi:MAG: ADP-ribosylglycohydrolase family protein [Capsulimonadales bacterium]|nr:ADP-ribosylglycohydrolase family protein [Capsulimonadales bacterium]
MRSESLTSEGQRNVVTVRAKFLGSLLGGMVADGFGAPTQGWNAERVEEALSLMARLPKDSAYRALYEGVLGPLTGRFGHSRFHYTDDTQMTISVTESLVASGRFDGEDMARRLAENFDAGRSYGPGIFCVIQHLRRGVPWNAAGTQVFGGQGSSCNGGAARVGPIGLLFHDLNSGNLRRVVELATSITHAHPLGIEGAVLQALAVAVAVRLDPFADFDPLAFLDELEDGFCTRQAVYQEALTALRGLVTRHLRGGDVTPRMATETLGHSSEASASVPLALCAFLLHPRSFEDATRFAVRMGGATDTQAALCGTVSGAYLGHAAIPAEWIEVIENEGRGRDYLGRLGLELYQVWQTPERRPIPLK